MKMDNHLTFNSNLVLANYSEIYKLQLTPLIRLRGVLLNNLLLRVTFYSFPVQCRLAAGVD